MTKTTEEGLDLIRKVLDWDVRYRSGPEANERLMIAACAGSVDLDVVCATFDKIRPQLVYSELWEESVRGLKLAHPEWQINQADLNILAAEWSLPGLLDFDVSADGLIKLAETLNKKQTFAFTDAYTAQQAEITLRARLIQEVSQGRTDFYEARDGGNSYIQKFRVDELPQLSTKRLQEVRDIVVGQRELEAMDSKKWLADQKAAGIRRDQERVGLIAPPPTIEKWRLTKDGDVSRYSSVQMKAGDLVDLTSETIKRMSRSDLFDLVRATGADRINSILKK